MPNRSSQGFVVFCRRMPLESRLQPFQGVTLWRACILSQRAFGPAGNSARTEPLLKIAIGSGFRKMASELHDLQAIADHFRCDSSPHQPSRQG